MNKFLIFIVIIIFLIILFVKLLAIRDFEHFSSDEAIQNLASLYSKDQIAVGKIKLGDKWVISGVEPNDDVFRVFKADGTIANMKVGQLSASELTDATMGGPVKVYVDTKNSATKSNIDNTLSTTNTNIKNYVDTEVKAVASKVSSQDVSTFYNNGKVTIDSLQLGNKWALIGGNDDVLRIFKADGSGLANVQFGQFTADSLTDKSMGKTVKAYVDDKYTALGTDLNNAFNTKISDVSNKVTNISSGYGKQLADLSAQVGTVNTKLTDTTNTLNATNTKVTDLTTSIDSKINALSTNVDNKFTGIATNFNTKSVKTDKLQLGDKWLISGVGDAYANDDWLRLYKTDGSQTYYGGVAAGKLFDARIGDLQAVRDTLKGNIDGAVSRLGTISGTRGGYACVGGYDLPGSPFNVNNLDECDSGCRSRFPGVAMCAMSRSNDANDKRCWCKSIMAVTPDGNWNARLLV